MKAISLWQPWASLLVAGVKKIETRSWYTSYRGPLLIHAAKRMHKGELKELSQMSCFHAAMNGADMFDLPYGAIIGMVELVGCEPTESLRGSYYINDVRNWRPREGFYGYRECDLGNYGSGRYGWMTEIPIMFETPIPYKGSQGFFEVPNLDYIFEVVR